MLLVPAIDRAKLLRGDIIKKLCITGGEGVKNDSFFIMFISFYMSIKTVVRVYLPVELKVIARTVCVCVRVCVYVFACVCMFT